MRAVGIYSDFIFPHLLEWMLGTRQAMDYRRRALSDAHGEVLEIGFGTGLNLSCFPPAVQQLTMLDPSKMLPRRVAKRIASAPMPIEQAFLNAEKLPFDAGRFDTVVSTWTMCTIPDVVAAVREVRRVLKPGGRLLFLEHGRSSDEGIARRQDRWNGVQRVVGCGCNLNRAIDQVVETAGLRIERLDRFQMPGAPKIGAEHYLGAAVR
jgi:ubiquinone/menaquinone biosynthesis C-methylase UbiE